MKKFVCIICGYVYEGEAAPNRCPVCGSATKCFHSQSNEIVEDAAFGESRDG